MDANRKGYLLAAGSALLGAAFLMPYKEASTSYDRGALVCAMLTFAALFNSLTVAGRWRALRVDRTTLVVSAVIGLFTAFGNVAQTEALARLSSGVTSVLLQTQILLVTVSAWLVLGERVTARFAIGATLAIGGFVIMRAPWAESPRVDAVGMFWGLGAAASFAIMHVITRRYIERIQPVAVNALRLWLAVVVLWGLPGNLGGAVEMPTCAWLLAALAAFFGPYAARICIMFSVRHISASHAALVTLVSPVFAFALAFVIFGTVPGPLEAIGGAVMLIGVSLPVWEMVAGAARARRTGDPPVEPPAP